MATCKSTPRSPTAIEVAAITAGPVKNLTAIANVATLFPQEMIFGCSAMNRPGFYLLSDFLDPSKKEQNVSVYDQI
jgi:hypothetical protein